MSAICVYCASAEPLDPSYRKLAAAVGTALGRAGHSLVSGGGRVSMMGAVATAARAAGAHTVGVIPRALLEREVADVDADELVVVETMRERKRVMDERADGFLALPGGLGTLEELFEVWTARTLHMHDKPVVVLDPQQHYGPLWQALQTMVSTGFVRPAAFAALELVDTVDAALRRF